MLERSAPLDSPESLASLVEAGRSPCGSRHLGAADGGGEPQNRRSPIVHAHFHPATEPGVGRVRPLTGPRRFEGAPREGSSIQEVRFLPRQGPASQRESSLALCEATTTAKRRQSDRQATTPVKRISPVPDVEQMPTVSSNGKAPVGVGYGDCAGESAGVEARGMPGNG